MKEFQERLRIGTSLEIQQKLQVSHRLTNILSALILSASNTTKMERLVTHLVKLVNPIEKYQSKPMVCQHYTTENNSVVECQHEFNILGHSFKSNQ
jgi:hypothetical protein